MLEENKNQRQKDHYVCLGGCRGVSKKPGICQAPDCKDHNHALVKCSCTDGKHYDFAHA